MQPTDIHVLDKANGLQETEYLRIHGASCASCVSKIEGALHKVEGVKEAVMNLAQSTVSVTGHATAEAMINAIRAAGYDAESITDRTEGEYHVQIVADSVCNVSHHLDITSSINTIFSSIFSFSFSLMIF